MGTSDRWKQLVRPKRRRRVSKRSFYDDDCLSEAERVELRKAADVADLGEEIAVLRVRLKKALNDHPDDYELLASGLNVLVRAVAAQYRLSPRAKKDLTDNFAAVFNSLGDHMVPADKVGGLEVRSKR
ncbi:MAG TPA: hypothetical protein VGR43_09105 [Dehalococcoidia bacterium]|jgi:hypothetical protein|nr:hypothetical protein [Dehalococcoidia bacterium]